MTVQSMCSRNVLIEFSSSVIPDISVHLSSLLQRHSLHTCCSQLRKGGGLWERFIRARGGVIRTKMTDQTLLQKYVLILSVVTAYWFVSITLGRDKPPPLSPPLTDCSCCSVCQQIPPEWFPVWRSPLCDVVPVCGHGTGVLCSQAGRQVSPGQNILPGARLGC